MSAFPTKRSRPNDDDASSKKARAANPAQSAPRPAPSFLSSLQSDETDFPRGGGSSLTALEYKQVREEGRREAEDEVRKEASAGVGQGVKRKRQVSEREKKRLEKNVVKAAGKEIEGYRVEQLNYKRLVTGTRLLTRVHTILPLHLILSLPNNLLAHVPITEISTTLTNLLTAEAEDESDDEKSEAGSSSSPTAPDLSQIFTPGQYFPARVLQTYPTASQSFVSQYPMTEVTRLAAKVEMTLVPETVNAEVGKGEAGEKGYFIVGEVKGEEDKGWRVGLGVGEGGMEGWAARDDVERFAPGRTLIPGQLLPCTTTTSTAGGRIMGVTLDPTALRRAQLSEISNIGSILPGHAVSALVTAVTPSGLNVKVCGFFDGTIDLAHLGLGTEDIDDKYKIGKKIRARIIYDNLAHNPRKFALSVLPHILALSSPTLAGSTTTLEEAIPIGKVFNSVTVSRVIPEWGAICRTDDGLEGFVHISHISDERIPALSSTTGQFRSGTVHRARVIGQSPLDGILLLSFEQKVLDQVFMQVGELHVGQALKGTIRRLTDKALFIDINGSVDGMVNPLHYADIRLKNPEKRFKAGNTVKARILALEPARNRVILTLKKTLVDSELEVVSGIEEVKIGLITPAVVCKILDKGCLVEMFGGVKAFVPLSEASQNFLTNLNDIFFVGKSVNVRVTEVDQAAGKVIASIKQALPTALAAAALDIGSSVSGLVSQIHAEQVVVTLIPSQLTALISLSNLSNHRHMGVEELRSSLKVGEHLEDLVIVSKNATSGLYIVSNKRTGSAASAKPSKAERIKSATSTSELQQNGITSGRVVSQTPQGTIIQLTPSIQGRVHPCDVSDDLSTVSSGNNPLIEGNTVKCYILKTARSPKLYDLSTRPSRIDSSTSKIQDKEINEIKDVKEGEKVRGLIKNIGDHGVFVSLGRNVTARIMIRELFDEFVKEWKGKFAVNQLVEGKILSVDLTKGLVEMTLRKNPGARGSKGSVKLGLGDFEEGQKVIAVVKRVEAYGIFLRIENTEVSGLCHKSEISDNKKQDVSQALKGFREGDQVKAKIVKIEREAGKINFGIKASYFGEEFGGDDVEMDGDDNVAEAEDEEVAAEDEEDEGEDGEEDEEDDDDDEDEEDADEGVEEEGDSIVEDVGESDDDAEAAPIKATSAPQANGKASSSGLKLANGFDWSGNAPVDPASDSESDEEEEEDVISKSTKSKGKSRAIDLTATSSSTQPQTSTEFERALLASPNSSFLWIQYMSFHLQLHEIDQARRIGRMALERINYREEEEKLNVWMALVNLEIGFGTPGTMDAVFKEASEFNDKRTVYLRYAEALQAAGKENLVEDIYKKVVKRFSEYPESWTKFAEYYLKKGDVDSARELLPRSMKSLDKSKHVETIEKMAILEFKHGDAERGKTLLEGLIDRAPKRLDLLSVYVDQLAKIGDIQGARGLFDRALDQKLTSKRAKFIFKKWLAVEVKVGDAAGQDKAKTRAREWVAANAKVAEDGDEDED